MDTATVATAAYEYAAAVFAYKGALERLGHAARPGFVAAQAECEAASERVQITERNLCHAATGGRVITAPTAAGAYPCPVN